MKPWHDTPIHACSDGARGPISPFYDSINSGDVRHLRCCACGDDWIELDIEEVAKAWWSFGAYEGKEFVLANAEDPC